MEKPKLVILPPDQLSLGYAAMFIGKISVQNPTVEIHIRSVQIRIGNVDETWDDCADWCGVLGAEPIADDWWRAAIYAVNHPKSSL